MASRSSNPPLLPRAFRAWPLAWPSPSGPLGWQRSPGSTARRRRVPRSGMRSTVEAGGGQPGQCAAFRPGGCDILPATGAFGATLTAWSWCWQARQRGYGGNRRRPVTGGAVRGSRRAVGLASEGRGGSCRPATARPRVNPDRLRRGTLAALSPQLLAPVLAAYGRDCQAWRAEGAPLKP